MKLNETEQAIAAGEWGEAARQALDFQRQIGRFFDARDFVEVDQVHIMGDGEAVGDAGLDHLRSLADQGARVRVPTVTDPRGADFDRWQELKQDSGAVDRERAISDAMERLGIWMTDTCINYQVIMPPTLGQHLAYGDTGSSINANAVFGARTNFEGGPSALAAALTGRTARYGFHLDEHRRGNRRYVVETLPEDWAHWGALGGIIGRDMTSYFETPVIEGIGENPGGDALKHFGAALASFGSTPLYHMVGITPEAPDLKSTFDGPPPDPDRRITRADLDDFLRASRPDDDRLDVVVFAAPQLSLFEMGRLAELLKDRPGKLKVPLLATVPAAVKTDCDRFGITETLEEAGATILVGVCFYQMGARELGLANGWTRLMTNSAKIMNILAGYGYEPTLDTMEKCVESALAGRIVP